MVFSSPIFLFIFLPAVLYLAAVTPKGARNFLLLVASLIFYAWGEPRFLGVMLVSIAANYGLGLWVGRTRDGRNAKLIVALAVCLNLGLLGVFKYAKFVVANLNDLLATAGVAPFSLPDVALPLGISFFTFHALSYVIDIYRRAAEPQRNPINFALYISFFPQLIAGPIIRYHDIATQLTERVVTRDGFAVGVRRFVVGLAKKVLIANVLAVPADAVFALPNDQLTAGLSWLGIACYTLQIYFDFSGYSDMAIGLARMFGFRFLENFNYPYISQSITEFWRRWHISLSNWYRDYLYIPLGGNRRSPWRTYVNLITVFFLCGLWHGASWSFVVWGMFHGAFLVLERIGLGRWLEARRQLVRHAYAVLVVMIGWVFFRSLTLTDAAAYLLAMAGFGHGAGIEYHVWLYLDHAVLLALGVGAIGSAPVLRWIDGWLERLPQPASVLAIATAQIGGVVLLFALSLMRLSAGTYNPFIYFRF